MYKRQVVQYITVTVQPIIPIGTSKQFQVPSGSTWEEVINSYGGSDAGFYADAGYVSYLASQEFSRVCMVFEQSTERIVRTSDVIMANYTYSYAPVSYTHLDVYKSKDKCNSLYSLQSHMYG